MHSNSTHRIQQFLNYIRNVVIKWLKIFCLHITLIAVSPAYWHVIYFNDNYY